MEKLFWVFELQEDESFEDFKNDKPDDYCSWEYWFDETFPVEKILENHAIDQQYEVGVEEGLVVVDPNGKNHHFGIEVVDYDNGVYKVNKLN